MAFDVESGRRRTLTPARRLDFLSLSVNGRILSVEDATMESDIWLLEVR